jgi:hypothetical protein
VGDHVDGVLRRSGTENLKKVDLRRL